MTHRSDERFKSGFGVPRPSNIDIELIVVHQTGNRNPGSTAKANLDYFANTKAASIHHIVDCDEIVDAVPHDQIAWHVAETRIAAAHGYPTSAPGRKHRGDVCTVGVEICVNHVNKRPLDQVGEKTIPDRYDDNGWPKIFKSPSRVWQLDAPTYINAIQCVAELAEQYPNALIVGHGHLDPWTRNTDPFGVLPDGWSGFIQDVHEAMTTKPPEHIDTGIPVPPPGHGLTEQQRNDLKAARQLIERVLYER